MLASSDPQWLQWAFTQLVGLFDRVGLNTNSGKTVSMTCRPSSTTEKSVGGGIWTPYYGRRTYVQGEEEIEDRMRGLRKGGGGGVAGLPPHDTAQKSTGEGLDMEGHGYGGGRRGRATDITARVPHGGGKGVSSGRVPGEVRDTDGNVSALLEEARAGHHYHLGGGKPPPSQMHKL